MGCRQAGASAISDSMVIQLDQVSPQVGLIPMRGTWDSIRQSMLLFACSACRSLLKVPGGELWLLDPGTLAGTDCS